MRVSTVLIFPPPSLEVRAIRSVPSGTAPAAARDVILRQAREFANRGAGDRGSDEHGGGGFG